METVPPLMGREDFWHMPISRDQELEEILILILMSHGHWEIPITMVSASFLSKINDLSFIWRCSNNFLIDKLKAESLYITYKSIKVVFKAFLYWENNWSKSLLCLVMYVFFEVIGISINTNLHCFCKSLLFKVIYNLSLNSWASHHIYLFSFSHMKYTLTYIVCYTVYFLLSSGLISQLHYHPSCL